MFIFYKKMFYCHLGFVKMRMMSKTEDEKIHQGTIESPFDGEQILKKKIKMIMKNLQINYGRSLVRIKIVRNKIIYRRDNT